MSDKPVNNPKNQPKKKINFYWIYAIMAILFVSLYFFNGEKADPEEVSWSRLEQMYKNHDVDKIIVVNKEFAEIYIKADKVKADSSYKDAPETKDNKGPHYKLKFLSSESFDERIDKIAQRVFEQDTMKKTEKEKAQLEQDKGIEYTSEERTDWGSTIFLNWILPIAIVIGIWFLFMRMMNRGSGGGQIFNVGKSKAQLFDKDTQVHVTFKDVAGLEEAKVEVVEVVDFLKNPKKYTSLGGKIPKGVLLVGPPGTGKTLLAKAVAGEAKVPFFSISGSDFVEMFVGVGASRVRDLFRQAKEKAPCIVFIDEIDAIGRARGRANVTGANDERENTLNQLLTEMDGFSTNAGVIILAATNRADILDKALMRAGRFDRLIYVELPDLHERDEIFGVHIKPLKLADDVNTEFLSKQTPGFSGADIANVCNEAALIAARKAKKAIEKQDFLDAIDRIIAGLEKRNKIISVDEKKAIAYHEAGHASVSWLLQHAHPLVKVTIIPRGKALGAAWYLPEERSLTTWDQIFDEITSALGGRASEEVNFNQVSTGALNDLEKVTKQAYASVAYFGLSKAIGNISYFDSSGSQEFYFTKPYSEKTSEIIDSEVRRIVESAYERAKEILITNKEKVSELAKILLEKEVIFAEDVERIFGPRPWPSRELEQHKAHLLEEKKPEDDQPEEPETDTNVADNKEDTPKE